MDLFGGVVYINLDQRTDRRKEIEGVLEMLGISGERFAAIPHEYGIYGCGQSHLAVLKMARDRKWRNVLILEDDFEPIIPTEEFWRHVRAAIKEVEELEGDALMLAYNALEGFRKSDSIYRLTYARTSSSYVIWEKHYDELIRLAEWSLPQLLSRRDLIFALDEMWRVLQQNHEWYGVAANIGRQRASWSDIQKEFVSYEV